MSTTLEEKPVELTPEQTSQNLGASPAPFLTATASNEVYASPNIQQIDIPGNKKAMDMKLSKLEDKLSKANSIADLNQISIMNQPKAMGVLTGEAAYRSKLDTARLNAFNSLYQNRRLEEQRKETERQQFMQTYGADPKKRPKGMSKREFIKALSEGKFQDLVSPEFKSAKEEKALDLALKKKQLAGGGTVGEKQGQTLVTAENTLIQSRGTDGFADPNVYKQQRQNYVSQGGSFADFDAQFGGYLSEQEKSNLKIAQMANLTPKQQTVVGQISGQFDNEQVVKEYNTLQQQKVFMNSLDNNTNNPADDQAVIYAFAKVMDPNSVVREGEYNTVQEYSQALLSRYGFKAKRVFENTGFLTSEARKFLKETLNNRIKANEQSYNNIYNEYGRRIEETAGVKNGATYLTNYGGGYQTTQSKPQQMNLNGKVYVLGEDGNYYPQ